MNYLLMATAFLEEGGTEPVGVPGWVPIVIGIILLLLFIWGLNRNRSTQGGASGEADHHAPELHSEPHAEAAHHEEPAVPEESMPAMAEAGTYTKSIVLDDLDETSEPDDLKKVEGIGPKIEGILHDADITTFAALAATSVARLEKIVREDAGIRVAFPATWPEQAELAAAGNWDALAKLQDELKGGRRT